MNPIDDDLPAGQAGCVIDRVHVAFSVVCRLWMGD